MSTGQESAARRLRPNLVLTAKREQRGWSSRRKAARELHRVWQEQLPGAPDLEALEKSLYRHETGRAQVRDEMYRKLYCLAYDASPHELFGSVEAATDLGGEYRIRSHKFIPTYVGPDAAARLAGDEEARPAADQWIDCHSRTVSVINGNCDLYVWPFGVAILHLAEDLALPSLAALAVWRQQTYTDNLTWAPTVLGGLLGTEGPKALYVFSTYWMQEPIWSGEALETALRITCMPKVLLERHCDTDDALGHAELVEQTLMVDGFEHPETLSFGVKGISAGYASWSGVVYYPMAEQRALAESDLIACELATQSMWAYCAHLNNEVEQGRDPIVPDEYGWRFLRAVRSRLTNPRPQETGQHRSMRSAILDSSGVGNHLSNAIETLRA